jgi:hypothetical protein
MNTRFISISHPPPIRQGDTTCNVIVGDTANWMRTREQIVLWLEENAPGWKMKGMILTFPDEATRLMFMMRWA